MSTVRTGFVMKAICSSLYILPIQVGNVAPGR
jgi:hypothetical protein